MSYDAGQGTLKLLKRSYAEKTRRTIFFVGAGASTEAGLPTWHDLREALHSAIDGTVDSGSASKVTLDNFRELESLRANNDYWGYFEHAEQNWGTTYNDALKNALDIDYSKVPLPVVYEKLWSMRNVRQIATLNVDGLLNDAFRANSRTKSATLLPYDGYSVTDSQTFIAKDAYCCLNLHGTVYQKSRWVMNGAERRKLTEGGSSHKYRAFLTWLFQSHNVVFVGVNPEDVAVSPALQLAQGSGILGEHYWICPTPSDRTRRWAEKNGVRLIIYQPEHLADKEYVHSSTICSILDDLENYTAPEPEVKLPESHAPVELKDLPEAAELAKLMLTDRSKSIELLSGAAVSVGRNCDFCGPQFDSFIKQHSLPIQMATALDSRVSGHDVIGKYKLLEKIQGSGSSSVWLTEDVDQNGAYMIAKILNGAVHEDEAERQSFRRGIMSMYLLNGSNSPIAPKYVDHFETPLVVIMEHVTGSSLRDVVGSGLFNEPSDALNIFNIICRSVRSCHTSDGRVLHRDLKPGNIIFEDWFAGYEKSQLLETSARLINFDLSWHRYSSGNTKAISAEESGYYAPEQKVSKNVAPPRSAATDTYMLGMILYYLISSEHPPEGGARLIDWPDQVRKFVSRKFRISTASNRVTRLILSMTTPEMHERLDIEAAQAEIESLLYFMSGDFKKVDHDLLVEHLLAETGREYTWITKRIEGRVNTSLQASFTMRYQLKGMKCEVEFHRSRGDADNRSSFGPRINQKIQESMQTLCDAGWQCELGTGVVKVMKASIRLVDLLSKSDLGASEIRIISDRLLSNFD